VVSPCHVVYTQRACYRVLCASDFAFFERFDDVASLQVLEVGQTDTALEALAHFANVVFESAQ